MPPAALAALALMAALDVAPAGMAGEALGRESLSSAPPKPKRQKSRPMPRPARKAAKPPFHPLINRWTGKPHEHRREIARRVRQTLARL
jgi:hypothetical protein